MLELIKRENIYDVTVKDNGKVVGFFLPEVDGFYYFQITNPTQNGLWQSHVLIEIGNLLEELNKPWVDHLNEYFK
jgi:hypothetical protein